MEIDKLGNLKTLKELKEKLRKMKEAWKKNARTITTEQSPEFCQFYEDLDEILATRDVVNIQIAREIDSADNNITNITGNSNAIEGMPCSLISNNILQRTQSFAKQL